MTRFLFAAILSLCGRVSSQHGRNDGGGVELRKPRKEEVVPSEEDRHKYIFDGTEYSRRPNLFDVGGGELKLLPEVLSDLNFEARNFVDSKSDREQKDLRDSRPWGRVYLDGWPAPIQYLRSHFGGPATIGMQRFVLASPLDACEPLRNAQSAASAVIVAARGLCTYTTKARIVQEASGIALLVVNNEPGSLHPPGPDGKHLEIFSAMIPEAEGKALIRVAKADVTRGMLVPMNCMTNSGIGDKNQQCHPAAKADRELIDGLSRGGFLHVPGGGSFEYLLAEFGVKVPSRELSLSSSQASDGCNPPDEEGGEIILTSRGKCSFIDKAEAAMAGLGEVAALIVINNETSLFHMGASPRWRGASVPFPTLLVSDLAGQALSMLPPNSSIQLTPSPDAKLAAWDEIKALHEASAWSKSSSKRDSMLQSLVSTFEGFPDRLSAVRQAYSAVSGAEENEKAISTASREL